eukprot:XP_001697739.1 SNF2 superfamily protein [Chlamydomonas reinhardtii]
MAYMNQPQPQPPYPCCDTCGVEARCMQTRSESSPNLGRDRSANDYRWFFKCPDGHKNRFFWADEWRRPAHPGPAGHQQHAAYDTHGSPRFGTAASQQDVPFHAGQPGHEIAPGDLGLKTPVYHEPFRDVIMQLPWPESGRHWDKGVGVWRIRSGCYLEVRQARDLLTRNGYRVQVQVLDILVKRTSAWSPRTTYKQAEEVGVLSLPLPRCQSYSSVSPDPNCQRPVSGGCDAEMRRVSACNERTAACSQWVLPKVDPELWGRLFAYQREGVLAGVRFGGRVLYADEMGLGKTVQQALTLMSCYTEDWPLLIICPTSLRFAWVAAVQQWLPPHLQPAPADLWQVGAVTDWDRLAAAAGIEPGSDHEEYPRGGGRAGGGGRLRPHIAVVSYDLATKIAPQHASRAHRYRAIICDECHALKNRTTQRAQKIGPLVRAADRAVLCTGTAILNRPIELFTQVTQVDMLKPGLLGSYTEYGDRYCVNTANTFYQQQQQQHQTPNFPGQEYTGANALGELKAVLGECVMVRRRKDEVLGDLPPKIRSKVPLQPCEDDLRRVAADLRELKRVLAAAAAGHMSGHEALSARQQHTLSHTHAQAWSAAYRATGPAKLTEAKAFLTRLLERVSGPCKVLVFAHHQEVLNGLQEHLKQVRVQLKVMHMRIDGSTPAHERDKAVAAFQRLGPRTPRVQVVVFVELDQSPSLLVQAEDRAHRVGQAAHVHVYYLMAKGYTLRHAGTLDEQIWAMLERKRFVCEVDLDLEGLDEQLFESASQPQEQLWGGSAGAGSGAGAGGGGSAGSGSQLYGYGVPRSAGSGYHSDAVVAMRRNLFWDSDEIHTPPTQPPPADVVDLTQADDDDGGGSGGGGQQAAKRRKAEKVEIVID